MTSLCMICPKVALEVQYEPQGGAGEFDEDWMLSWVPREYQDKKGDVVEAGSRSLLP